MPILILHLTLGIFSHRALCRDGENLNNFSVMLTEHNIEVKVNL
jgi:hypothetical protein